jgi:Flp pilus assembly protein TadG
MAQTSRRLLQADDGSNLVEFALASLIFFAVLMGIYYFSIALYIDHFVANVADAAARYAVVHGSTWNGASCASVSSYDCTATSNDVNNYVLSMIPPGISPSGLNVTTSWPGTTSTGGTCDTENGSNSPNCLVVVQVNYSFTLPLLLVGQRTMSLSSTATMTIVR